jgi:hypothetical protein
MNEDVDDECTIAIDAAHPINTGDHERYRRASELVDNRHSKQSIINLVNWLLTCVAEKKEQADLSYAIGKLDGLAEERTMVLAYLREWAANSAEWEDPDESPAQILNVFADLIEKEDHI